MADPEEDDPEYSGYCTQAGSADGDIAPVRISLEQLRQLTGDSDTIVIQSVVDSAIRDADDMINSYCGRKYVVPFDPIPSRIRNLSSALATFNLFEKRLSNTGGDVPDGIRKMYDNAVSFLKDVAAGRAVIDGAVTPTVNTNRSGGSFHANDRIFDADSMGHL